MLAKSFRDLQLPLISLHPVKSVDVKTCRVLLEMFNYKMRSVLSCQGNHNDAGNHTPHSDAPANFGSFGRNGLLCKPEAEKYLESD